MTGLFSRLAFDIQAADVIRKFKRRFFPVSLMIINLDRFKKVNDKWGHPVGDQVLKHVADILKDNLRQTDFPARYSGEEFVVILLDTPENGALFAAEKVRRKLELNPHKIAGKITVSIGVAALERDEAFEEWFMRADTALYLAKNMGRNQIVGSAESRGRDIKAIKYEWNKDWASGNAKIDEQHRALIEAGNRLIETHENCQRIEEQKAINELMIDLDQHFRSEEFVLKQHGYERLKEHSAIHESLRKQMRFWRDLRNQQRVNPTAFYSFLLEKVVIDHMITDDSKFFYLFK
jgi:diguanylate cyclase (GGDEF)-like protein/hemerythrin-like metal-binding protein